MKTDIKKYEWWVVFQTYDWNQHYVPQKEFDLVLKQMSTEKFIRFWEFEVEKVSNIKTTYPVKTNSVIEFLMTLPTQCRKEAKSIIAEREKDWLQTNKEKLMYWLARKLWFGLTIPSFWENEDKENAVYIENFYKKCQSYW